MSLAVGTLVPVGAICGGRFNATQALIEVLTVSAVSLHMDWLPAFACAFRASNTVRIIRVGDVMFCAPR
jgi:hypothetical protein